MNSTEIVVGAFAIALMRCVRLSPGAATRILLDMPLTAQQSTNAAIEWYIEASSQSQRTISVQDIEDAIGILETTVAAGIIPCVAGTSNYPTYLLEIADAPPVLYVKGNVSLLHRAPGVAIVGTRKASETGVVIAERIAQHFAAEDWTIVSGLALGIDAAAHRGALSVGGATIAVLAHGLRSASPKTNSLLGTEILERGGAWVSEYPVDVSARPEQFVHRNRIQIGLSAGSIIVEGEERSGTMTQADFCIQNKRKLFAVLPEGADRFNLITAGPRILINKKGATILRSKKDYAPAMQSMQEIRNSLAVH